MAKYVGYFGTVNMSKAHQISASAHARWCSAAICAAVLLGLAFLFFINPGATRWIPPCPFHFLTGLACPGCGSLRALHSAVHLEWTQALAYNPLTVLCLPFLGLWGLWHAIRAVTGYALPVPLIRSAILWSVVAMVGLFWIVRNVPLLPLPLFGH